MHIIFLSSTFLLFSIPLFYWIILLLFFNRESGSPRQRNVFFLGLLIFFIAQILLFVNRLIYNISFEPVQMYFYLWLEEIAVLFAVITGGYFLLVKKGLFHRDSYREFPSILSYTGGFLSLAGLIKIVSSMMKFDGYILFLYPLICMTMLLSVSLILTEAGCRRKYISVFLYLLLIPVSFLLALVPWLYYINHAREAVGIAVVGFISVCIVFFLLKKEY